jgi:hypothetical protein
MLLGYPDALHDGLDDRYSQVFSRKGLAMTKQIPKKKSHPATRKRGADPQVPPKSKKDIPSNSLERKLEQGLEESMAGSDPVSITQPSATKAK